MFKNHLNGNNFKSNKDTKMKMVLLDLSHQAGQFDVSFVNFGTFFKFDLFLTTTNMAVAG